MVLCLKKELNAQARLHPVGMLRSIERYGNPQDAFRTGCNQPRNIFSTERCNPDGLQDLDIGIENTNTI
jgi:hypothetical protein